MFEYNTIHVSRRVIDFISRPVLGHGQEGMDDTFPVFYPMDILL